MAIATALAVGATVAGSVLSSSSKKKAAGQAADATLAATQENNALQREIYDKNQANLSPYMQSGTTAGNYLNAFLGLPTPDVVTQVPAATAPNANQNGSTQNRTINGWMLPQFQSFFDKLMPQGNKSTTPATTTVTKPGVSQADARNAFAGFLGNSDYGYQSALGGQQVAGNYSGLGNLGSGAALKALQDRQNNINQGYQSNWLANLASQQGVGLSGASALAGVGQSYANAANANTTAAANSAANSYLVKGNNNPLANGLGTLGGTILG